MAFLVIGFVGTLAEGRKTTQEKNTESVAATTQKESKLEKKASENVESKEVYKNLPLEPSSTYSAACIKSMRTLKDIRVNGAGVSKEEDKRIGEETVNTLQECQTVNQWLGAFLENPEAMGGERPVQTRATILAYNGLCYR